MIQQGLNTRTGPMCKTVEDAARILDVIAGFDPNDELTAFSVGRLPKKPYYNYASAKRLDGIRIGVVREFMVDMYLNPSLVPHTATGSPNFRNIGPSGGDTGGAKFITVPAGFTTRVGLHAWHKQKRGPHARSP